MNFCEINNALPDPNTSIQQIYKIYFIADTLNEQICQVPADQVVHPGVQLSPQEEERIWTLPPSLLLLFPHLQLL